MKVLHLNVAADMTETPNLLKDMQYQVISVIAFHDALKLIQMESFDALVIEEGQMHPGTLDFISDARRVRLELPIFVGSEWGTDLPLTLKSLEAFAPAAEVY